MIFKIFKRNKPKPVAKTPEYTEEELLLRDNILLKNFDNDCSIFNGFVKCVFSVEVEYKPISEIDDSLPISIKQLKQNGNNEWEEYSFKKGFKYAVSTPINITPFYKKENAEKYAEKIIEFLNNAKKSINQ